MEVQEDFKELLALFNGHKVEYIIVGAYALAYHGAPRFTGDLDILVQPSALNAQKILSALADFGFGSLQLKIEDFMNPDFVIQLGAPPVRIGILTSLTGVDWEQAEKGKEKGPYGDICVNFLGRKQYIANKRAVGRKKDQADLEALGEE
jgi:hypothetical protein